MLKAIDTSYKGYKFRSRLEARWAVFFDAIGLDWEYEKEGFELGTAGRYLPDFWMPRQECWLEIKAAVPTLEDSAKIRALALESRKPIWLFEGEPRQTEQAEEYRCFTNLVKATRYLFTEYPQEWIDLYRDEFSKEPNEYGGIEKIQSVLLHGGAVKSWRWSDYRVWPMDSSQHDTFFSCSKERYREALAAFRSARFEHGQCG